MKILEDKYKSSIGNIVLDQEMTSAENLNEFIEKIKDEVWKNLISLFLYNNKEQIKKLFSNIMLWINKHSKSKNKKIIELIKIWNKYFNFDNSPWIKCECGIEYIIDGNPKNCGSCNENK